MRRNRCRHPREHRGHGRYRSERQQTEDTDARTSTPQPLSESVDDARSLEGGGDVARDTLCCERIGETPMPTETLDRVTEGPGTVFNDTNDAQALLTRGPRSGLGNRFNVQPSLKIEVLVGLPNSYSDLWVNIPDVIPPSAEDVECQQRGYAQETRLIRPF